jgi:hypothetical protein
MSCDDYCLIKKKYLCKSVICVHFVNKWYVKSVFFILLTYYSDTIKRWQKRDSRSNENEEVKNVW